MTIKERLIRTAATARARSTFSHRGLRFRVWEGVLNPTLFRSSLFFADQCLKVGRKLAPRRDALESSPDRPLRVLELGCGAGVPSLILAAQGCEVTATDIDPRSVANCQANARMNRLRLRTAISNWATAIRPHRFDLVLANPPFLSLPPSERRHPDQARWLDAGTEYEVFKAALADCRASLVPTGHALVLSSERTSSTAVHGAYARATLRRVDRTSRRVLGELFHCDELVVEAS